jgi:hypothetical protein
MLVDNVDLKERDEVVWQEGSAIFGILMRIQAECGFNAKDPIAGEGEGVAQTDHDGGIGPYASFAAASLQGLILEIGSEAWDDPLGMREEGEATTMFFAKPTDPLPVHFQRREPVMVRLAVPFVDAGRYIDHVMVDEEPESLGSRYARFLQGIQRIQGLCDGLGIDKPALEKVVAGMIDRIARQSPVTDPGQVATSYRSTSRRSKRGRAKPASVGSTIPISEDMIAA